MPRGGTEELSFVSKPPATARAIGGRCRLRKRAGGNRISTAAPAIAAGPPAT